MLTEIGGSMGPLYGVMFNEFAEKLEGIENIDAATFSTMLHAGLEGIQSIGSAKLGDKTLLDTLIPAINAFDEANGKGQSFAESLTLCRQLLKSVATPHLISWQRSVAQAVLVSVHWVSLMRAQHPAH